MLSVLTFLPGTVLPSIGQYVYSPVLVLPSGLWWARAEVRKVTVKVHVLRTQKMLAMIWGLIAETGSSWWSQNLGLGRTKYSISTLLLYES